MKWGFIYTLDDGSREQRKDVIGQLVCVGVRSTGDAAAVARRMVEEGVELIELCGAFGGAGLGEVTAAVAGRIPVGAVFYGCDASSGLHRLFGAKQ